MSPPTPAPEPRWICDEMLGKLARYLRFLGYDVEYARGVRDSEILQRAKDEDRLVLTRDKVMAERSRRVTLLYGVEVEQQLQEVWKAFPDLRTQVRFLRCSLCNARLAEADRSAPVPPKGVPDHVWAGRAAVYLCPSCGQAYWEGSHTDEIRRTLDRVFGSPARGG